MNNQDVNTLEIDYEKLADAIVKAQEKAKEISIVDEVPKKITLKQKIQILWAIITNKATTNGTLTSSFISMSMSTAFNILALLTVAFGVCIWFAMPSVNFMNIEIAGFFTVISLPIALIFRAIANELKKETDRNYIVALFSGLISLVALIIAIIALMKGVA